MKNKPYIKIYNEFGVVINPITDNYLSEFPNRKKRREELNKKRFIGCGKNYHLSVYGSYKYKRVDNFAFNKKLGRIVRIENYILIK